MPIVLKTQHASTKLGLHIFLDMMSFELSFYMWSIIRLMNENSEWKFWITAVCNKSSKVKSNSLQSPKQ